jgi:crotonobetainyl-CoA:carnitine CoA-transferase CaiB-like acyl-CoA transferase
MLGNDEVAPLPLEGLPVWLRGTPAHTGGLLHRGPPRLGEDNAAVLGELLGLSEQETVALESEGVLS